MNIGTIIASRRSELNLTLEAIGNYVGVSKGTVKKWENGYIENMKRDKIALLSEILQLSPLTFITGEYTPKNQNRNATALKPASEKDELHALFDRLNLQTQLEFFNELKQKLSIDQ
ncbi:MAG: helix-turn-helix domain-containing protein [Bacillota bacterium]